LPGSCCVSRCPTAHPVRNWLKQFTRAALAPLIQLNHDLVVEAITKLRLPRLTVDLDGTVVSTGATVQWAFRGFNPHHRKHLSYYPLVAHLAQTGHILRLKNRPGNVHDSKQAVAFLRELIDRLRTRVGAPCPWSSAWTRPFSNVTSWGCSRGAAVPTPSRSATGAGCPSNSWPPRRASGSRWRPA